MDSHRVLEYLLKEFGKLRDENASHIAAGRAVNYDEYRHVCGIIRGLTYAETLVRDLAKKMEIADD
jgi:hypothetical protein